MFELSVASSSGDHLSITCELLPNYLAWACSLHILARTLQNSRFTLWHYLEETQSGLFRHELLWTARSYGRSHPSSSLFEMRFFLVQISHWQHCHQKCSMLSLVWAWDGQSADLVVHWPSLLTDASGIASQSPSIWCWAGNHWPCYFWKFWWSSLRGILKILGLIQTDWKKI